MSVVKNILDGMPIREAISYAESQSVSDEIITIKNMVNDIVSKSNSEQYVKTSVEPYGVGFKVIFEPKNDGLKSLQNAIHKSVAGLGWENIDIDELRDGTVILYYR